MKHSLLTKCKPDYTPEEFSKAWDNNYILLAPLLRYLDSRAQEMMQCKSDDFNVPNHYAKLAYELGKKEAFEEIKNLLPTKLKGMS
jgi:hypothetical protein